MKNKFTMSKDYNITLIKRNIIDYVWKSANLEGINLTFPETEEIYTGLVRTDTTVEGVLVVNNLKHAWQFILDSLDYPCDFSIICHINGIVGKGLINNAGYVRKFDVKMGGTSWTPSLPEEDFAKETIYHILHSDNTATEKALDLLLYLMRAQLFADGNKRTAMMAANLLLAQTGHGAISITIENQREFRELLIKFYETNDSTTLKQWLWDNALDGWNIPDATDEFK